MSFATMNDTVWKEIASEKQDAARTMGRISAGLGAACIVLGMTAFSAHSNYSSICSFVDERHQVQSGSYGDEEVTKILQSQYCS